MVSEKLLNSRPRIVLLVAAILSFGSAGYFAAVGKFLSATFLLVTGLIIIRTLVRIYNTGNEAVISFFDSLRNDDTTYHFQGSTKNRPLNRLYESMNALNRHFQDIRIKNENNESYYRTLIQHTSTGILVLDSHNHIELINKAACNYAGISWESTNTNLLKIRHPAFFEAVCNLQAGESMTYRHLLSGNLQLLTFRATMIRRKEETLKLVAIQDIRNELESRELESYKKLMSVMTHEIMNLLSPLTSASRELYSIFRNGEKSGKEILSDESTARTVENGLELINDQSNGLLNFVNNYRQISRIPLPQYEAFSVTEWVEQLKIAYTGRMKENDINFRVTSEKSTGEIIADKKLLNQVMINLINNSLDAVMENPADRKITVRIGKNQQNKVVIRVQNNGPAIPPELLERIFVPFFTTKKSGSGIGLSISQEIMKLHKGSIIAFTTADGETCFTLEF